MEPIDQWHGQVACELTQVGSIFIALFDLPLSAKGKRREVSVFGLGDQLRVEIKEHDIAPAINPA